MSDTAPCCGENKHNWSEADQLLCDACLIEELQGLSVRMSRATKQLEKLEAVAQAAEEIVDQDVKVRRTDGGENRLVISLANLERALEAL